MSAFLNIVSIVFWGCLLLSVLVFVHEGGHYLAARMSGMRVTEFFLGMPCRWRISRKSKDHGTEVGVTPILLGGCTRICGMDALPSENAAKILAYVSERGRVEVSAMCEELGLDEDAVYADLNVLTDWASLEPYYDPELGEKPNQSEWTRQVQTVRRDANLLTAFDSGHDFSLAGSTMAGEPHALVGDDAGAFLAAEQARTYLGKKPLQKIWAVIAGPLVNIVLGFAMLCAILSIGGVSVTVNLPIIGSVSEGSLADAAGLKAGDEIESVNGVEVSTWVDMGTELRACIADGDPFEVAYARGEEESTVTVDPAEATDGSGLFGVNVSTEMYYPDLLTSLRVSWSYIGQVVESIIKLITPTTTAEVVSQSTSVVGISVMASEAASSGAADYLFLLAGISLSLGFMNLIPILPLDGGHLLIEIVQVIARRRVPQKLRTGISLLGLALFMLLFVVVLKQDLTRYVFGG
jgi:regulator of sigma E protease